MFSHSGMHTYAFVAGNLCNPVARGGKI